MEKCNFIPMNQAIYRYFSVLIYIVVSFISIGHCQVNLAVISSVRTEDTCGNPPEQYFETWQGNLSPKDRIPYICNASASDLAHPPAFLIDDDTVTFWQSTADRDVVTLNFDLRTQTQKSSFVSGISLGFGAYQRPGQIFISKSQDGGKTYIPWHYLVAFPFECQTIFGRNYITKPFSSDTVLCTTFSNFIPLPGNETVNINLRGGRDPETGIRLQQWMNATNIRIRFSGLYKKFDKFSKRWHHYSVRDVNITGFCSCNGHASECIINTTTKSQKCVCKNNACGDQCQDCCNGFKQFPWKHGSKAPFIVDEESKCGACNCHNHSSQCNYNETVAMEYMSLDVSGKYNGGGVCAGCKHNTSGINCEGCLPFFYRPSSVSRYSPDACQECSCNTFGSKKVPQAQFLDCFRLGNATVANMSTGDCYCKENVHGRECNICKAGYFNLSSENNNGCQDCDCYSIGTVNGSNICQGDTIGQCPCKRNTIGRKCNMCADGSFNLSRFENDGCQDCFCDPGGRSSFVCNKINGSCSCKDSNIIGRKCDSVVDEYFYPTRHFINAIPTRTQIVVSWTSSIDIPSFVKSNRTYHIIIKYKSPLPSAGVVTLKSLTDITALSSAFKVNGNCSTDSCYHLINKQFHLTSETWQIFLNFDLPTNDAILLNVEEIILLPEEFLTANILGLNAAAIFNDTCSPIFDNVQLGKKDEAYCKQGVFSLTVGFVGRPFACNCNRNGSYDNLCDKYGGQCKCKDGVSGRQCDQCKPGFYNQTIDGCSACNCSGSHKVCNTETGQCQCPPNVIGVKCDKCQVNHWRFDAIIGCKNCNCSAIGSTEAQCNNFTGECSCQNGVGGMQCDHCLDIYYNLSSDGCSHCNCGMEGSLNPICEKRTGQCVCKSKTMGRQCNECKPGTFALSSRQQHGCIDCYCSGRTNSCSQNTSSLQKSVNINSAIGILPQSTSVIWSLATLNDANSWIGFYGGILSITYAIQSNSVLSSETKMAVFIKGEEAIMFSNFSLDVMSAAGQTKIALKELSWLLLSTNQTPSRNEFMIILSSPTSISANYVTYQNGVNTRLGPLSLNSLTSDKTSLVEICQCPEGYEGLSCERCSTGFKRALTNNDIMTSECISCQCHGHSKQCNQYNGICYNCTGSTFGPNCEHCLDGYYGNSTIEDCLKCPCASPRTSSGFCNKTDTGDVKCLTCSIGYEGDLCDRCSLGFYGNLSNPNDICRSCDCNGNSNTCDSVTGQCFGCGDNSAGFNCEQCQDEWYGNATKKTCQVCLCDDVGSNSSICDKATGQCFCRKNIEGRTCSRCKNDSYGFNNRTGCTSCECNIFGSVHTQCNESGVCPCDQNSTGVKCDSCKPLMFGLPLKTCSECACNSTGSLNLTCHTLIGSCHCKPGITGQKCNQCEKQHTNYSGDGCEACPECTQLLQTRLDDMKNTFSIISNNVSTLINLTGLENELEKMQLKVMIAEENRDMFTANLTSLRQSIEIIGLSTLNISISNLSDLATNMLGESKLLLDVSTKDFNRIMEIRNNATSSTNSILAANQTVDEVLRTLDNWNQTVNNNYNALKSATVPQPSIEVLNSTAHNSLTEINITMNILQKSQEKLNNQQDAISNMPVTSAEFINKLTSMQNVSSELNANLTKLWKKQKDLNASLNEVKETEIEVKDFLKNITGLLNDTNVIVQDIQMQTSMTSSMLNDLDVSLNTANLRLADIVTVELPTLRSLIDSKNPAVDLAFLHSKNLSSSAAELNLEVNNAFSLQLRAIDAVERYKQISMLVNNSLIMSTAANISLGNIVDKIRQVTGNNLTAETIQIIVEANGLLLTVNKSSLQIAGLSSETNSAVNLYANASNIWNKINDSFNEMESKKTTIDEMISRNELSNSLETNVDKAISVSKTLNNGLETTSMEDEVINQNITLLQAIVNDDKAMSETTIGILNNVSDIGAKIQNKLLNNPSLVDDVAKMNEHVKDFNTISKKLDDRLSILRKKIAQIKTQANNIKTGAYLGGNNNIKFDIKNRTHNTKEFDEIQLDFRTNQKDSVLIEAGNENKMSSCLKIQDGLVTYLYQTDSINASLTNWGVKVDDGKWKRAYATRYGLSARLTVTDLQSNYHQTYQHRYENQNLSLAWPNTSKVLLGFSEQIGLDSINFIGCVSSISFNEINLLPFSASTWKEKPSHCNTSTRIPSYSDVASFGPSSYLKHGLQKIERTQNISSITFEFRTDQSDLHIMDIKSSNNTQVITVTIKDGFVVMATNDKQLHLKTRLSVFNNNQWHRIILSFSSKNSTMSLISNYGYANTSFDIRQSNYTLSQDYYDGFLVFGFENKEKRVSNVETVSFCLKSLQIDLSTSSAWLQFFDDGRTLIDSHEIAFGICNEEVLSSYKFLPSSKSRIDLNETKIDILSLSFRTKANSGTLLLGVSQSFVVFIMLFHGDVVIQISTSNSQSKNILQTTSQSLNDGATHNITLEIAQNDIVSLHLDNMLIQNSSIPGSSQIILNHINIGNVGDVLPLHDTIVGIKRGLDFNLVDISINSIRLTSHILRNHSLITVENIKANITIPITPAPTYPPPTSKPPSCGLTDLTLETSKIVGHVGFDYNGYMVFKPADYLKALNFFKQLSFLVTIEFRSLSQNGVIFYSSRAADDSSQFISLELVNGRLLYQLETGNALIKIFSSAKYADGVFHKVYLLRILQDAVLLVANTKDYQTSRNDKAVGDLKLNFPFYIGGIPSAVEANVLQDRNVSFIGCISQVEVSESANAFQFELSRQDSISSSRSIRGCYSAVAQQASFKGNGYVKLKSQIAINDPLSIEIKFYSTSRYGLLWYLKSDDNIHQLSFQQIAGQLLLTHKNQLFESRILTWSDANLDSTSHANSSYVLCNASMNSVTVSSKNGNYTIKVNNQQPVIGFLGISKFIANVFVGGMTGLSSSQEKGLNGCVSSFQINGDSFDLLQQHRVNATTGCRQLT